MDITHRLTSGETLTMDVLAPGEGRGDTPANREIWTFMTRPFDPWMTPSEAAYAASILGGMDDGSLHNYVYVARIEGAIVGTALHATARDSHAIGGYGNVLTEPAQRGKGIAQILTEHSTRQFWDDGGRAIYLGTVNPVAQHVYQKFGYQPYNGLAMRALRAGESPDRFDAEYFGTNGDVQVRDAALGDIAAYTALLLAHEPRAWIVRDFTEGIFYAPPAVQASGCLRPFYNTFSRHEANPANQFKLLVTERRRVVGAASVQRPLVGALGDQAVLEFACYPTYQPRLALLLDTALEAAGQAGARRVRAYAAGDERGAVLGEVGFRHEASLTDALDLGDRRVDVRIFSRDLA